MEHIEKPDLILIASGRNSVVEQIASKLQHLKSCQICHKRLTELKLQLQIIKAQKEEICDAVFERLSQSLENSHPPELPVNLQEHLEKCHDCQAMLMLYQQLSVDELENVEIDIPEEKLEMVRRKIFAELFPPRGRFEPLVNSLIDLKTYLYKTRTIILETELAPLFSPVRGEIIPGKQIFCHKGGKVRFRTDRFFKKVILYAIFSEKFYEKMTDGNGEVLFDNLEKDDYRIEIDGFLIKNVNEIL